MSKFMRSHHHFTHKFMRFQRMFNHSKPLTILDGSMGSYLQTIGVQKNTNIWSAGSLVDSKYHDLVIKAHKEYLKCGVNVITTNNYSCVPIYLRRENIQNQMLSLTDIAVKLANKAKTEYITECADKLFENQLNDNIKIAGSVPPLSDNHRSDRILSENESLKYYSMIVEQLCKNGMIDILLIETMSSIEESLYALKSILCYQSLLETNKVNEIWISFSMKEDGTIRSNESLNDAIKSLEQWIEQCNVKIISMNCCFPEAINIALSNLSKESIDILKTNDVKLGMYPNGTGFIGTEWTYLKNEHLTQRDDLKSPKNLYERFYKKWLIEAKENGYIGMIGGCCSITPNHMEYIVRQIGSDFPELVQQQKHI